LLQILKNLRKSRHDISGHKKIDMKEDGKKTAECVRYSDEDLKEFREHILVRLEEARTDYDLLKSAFTGDNENGTGDTSPGFNMSDDASDLFTREEIARLAIRRQKYMEQLKNALVRIENRSYGICRISGRLISKERLKSVPHTTISIDAKLHPEKAAL
jgi:DnaK suppressor protein